MIMERKMDQYSTVRNGGVNLEKHNGVRAIERACDILLSFTKHENELGLGEISERVRLPKSTIHRIIRTLESQGLIEQEENDGKYHLSYALIRLGDIARENYANVTRIALPEAKWLASECEQTVNLYERDKDRRICIEQVKGPQYVNRYSQVGNSLPLYCGASGLVILAGLDDIDLEAYLKRVVIEPLTENTITSKEKLRENIEDVRKKGYAFTRSERELYTASIAAPIINAEGEFVAVMAVSGPEPMFDEEHKKLYTSKLLEAAGRVSKRFGYDQQ